MKGRGILTMLERNRTLPGRGASVVEDPYDHDELRLDDLYEYEFSSQQVQVGVVGFEQPAELITTSIPISESRCSSFRDSSGFVSDPEILSVGGQDGTGLLSEETSGETRDAIDLIAKSIDVDPTEKSAGSYGLLKSVELDHEDVKGPEVSGQGHTSKLEDFQSPIDEVPIEAADGLASDKPDVDDNELFNSVLDGFDPDEDVFVYEDDDALDDTNWLDEFSGKDDKSPPSPAEGRNGDRRGNQRNLRYERSRQLAEHFLAQSGLLDESNLDMLSEVIFHKRWTAAQYRVSKLVREGYSIAQVHAAFELRRVWNLLMDSNPVPENRRHSLSWDAAVVLLESFRDWQVEVDGWQAHFLQSELECWLSKVAKGSWDGRFIDYLLKFRLVGATEVAHLEQPMDPALCVGLDGSHNPLFNPEWMEDWNDMGAPTERKIRLNILLGREGLNLY